MQQQGAVKMAKEVYVCRKRAGWGTRWGDAVPCVQVQHATARM